MDNKAVLLGRKSQVRIEADADSIERQYEDMDRYCLGHTPPLLSVARLADMESGYKNKSKNARPALREAMEMLRKGEAQHLVVARLDRLTRQGPLHFLSLLKEVEELGGALHILEYQIDGSKAMGRGILALLAAVAEEWAERTSTNVKRAELASAAAGKRHGGRRAYGWHQAPKSGPVPCPSCGGEMKQEEIRGRLVAVVELCPVESVVLREAALRVAGGASVRSVAVDFNKRGLRTATGKQWANATISRALQSPAIRGDRTHLGVEYTGAFPGVVTAEEFAAVQSALSRRGKATPGTVGSLLAGLGVLWCECGSPMRSAIRSREGGTARYRCSGSDPGSEGCGKVSAVQGGVDSVVVEGGLSAIDAWREKTFSVEESPSVNLERLLEEDRAAVAELTEARYVSRVLSDAAFLSAYEPLRIRIAETESLLSVAGVVAQPDDELLPALDVPVQEWWEGLDLDDQRTILRTVLLRVEVRGATGKGPVFNRGRVKSRFKVEWAGEISPTFEYDPVRRVLTRIRGESSV